MKKITLLFLLLVCGTTFAQAPKVHPQLFSCGSIGSGGGPCANSHIPDPVLVEGLVTLSGSGAATVTGIAGFQHSMGCAGSDATRANAVRVAVSFTAGNSAVGFAGAPGDNVIYVCIGS
jgi:hypothetical protein